MKNFNVVCKLGEGAFSQVFKVKRISDGQEYALKKVKMSNLSEKEKQNALNEIRILASIQNPNIVSYKESFLDDNSATLCIVMDLADGGDLQSKINNYKRLGQNIPEKEIWRYFIQMITGLEALHELKIVHRDIKCANLFLTKSGILKLGDLNVSKVIKRGLLHTQTGTPYYASPEVWQDKPYDYKSDIWSVGCVLYELTTLNPPFRANDMKGLYYKVIKGQYPAISSTYSSDLANTIKALLQVNPASRPTCTKILQTAGTQVHLSQTLVNQMDSLVEEIKESSIALLDTIKVPRNLGQITERLPKANYNSNPNPILQRNSSQPSRIGQLSGLSKIVEKDRESLQSARPSQLENENRIKGLAPIREDVRSAERARRAESFEKNYVRATGVAHGGQYYQQPQSQLDKKLTPIQESKENNNNGRLPKINEKPMLQRQASAIMGGVIQARYKPAELRGNGSQLALMQPILKPNVLTPSYLSPSNAGHIKAHGLNNNNPLMPRYAPMDYHNRYQL